MAINLEKRKKSKVRKSTAERTKISPFDLRLDEISQNDQPENDPNNVNLSQQGALSLPEYLFERNDITGLNLSRNNLRTFPSDIRKIVALKEFDVSQNPISCHHPNDFTGIPVELSHLQHLQTIKISQCNLRYIPPAIWKCRKLHVLDISHNKINVLPPDVGNLTALKRLNVQHTSVVTLPSEIAYCQDLEEVLLWGNAVESLPAVLRYLPKLKMLAVDMRGFASVVDDYMEGLLRKGQIQSEHLPAVVFEIPCLDELDLENTKINRLPDRCVGKLRELVLARNFFRTFPQMILTLDRLGFLDMSDNLIRSIPDEIGALKNLRTFRLNKNEIQSLPEAIGDLVSLVELSLSGNLLTTLPAAIGKLKNLETLVADHNLITALPDTIVDLEELSTFDLTGNLLKVLPEAMCSMKKLGSAHTYDRLRKHGLWLHKNPLQIPPQTVWKTDDAAKIYDHVRACEVEKLENCQRQKMIVLGNAGSGKTGLVLSITGRKNDSSEVEIIERTDLIQFSSWTTKNNVTVLIQDMAGSEICRTLLAHYFLDESAFYLLVVDGYTYTRQSYYSAIGCWIDLLLLRCPKAVLKVVMTHLDLRGDDVTARDDLTNHLSKSLVNHLKMHRKKQKAEIKRINEEIATEEKEETEATIDWRRKMRIQLTRSLAETLRLQKGISVVSSHDLSGMEGLVSELESTFLDRTLFPNIHRVVDTKWLQFGESIKACDGYYLRWQELHRRSKEVDVSETEMVQCLEYLQSVGKLVWQRRRNSDAESLVFHRPRKLIDVMRATFRRDMPEFLDFRKNNLFWSTGNFTEESFMSAKEDLLTRGHVSRSLLRCLWFPAIRDDRRIVEMAEVLQQLNLCYVVPRVEDQNEPNEGALPLIVIPYYNRQKLETRTYDDLWPSQQSKEFLELETSYSFPILQLPRFFCKLSCLIHDIVELRYDDVNVIAAKSDDAFVKVTKGQNNVISVRVCGSKMHQLETIHGRIAAIVDTLIGFFPGLQYRIHQSQKEQQTEQTNQADNLY